jgi:hypothetical protein
VGHNRKSGSPKSNRNRQQHSVSNPGDHPGYKPNCDEAERRHDHDFKRPEFNEEAAAELAVPVSAANADNVRGLQKDATVKTRSAARAVGWTALVLAVLSLFVWPVLLGGTAAVVGYVAFRQGSRGLGAWSITLGLIAAMVYLILVPIYYAIS